MVESSIVRICSFQFLFQKYFEMSCFLHSLSIVLLVSLHESIQFL